MANIQNVLGVWAILEVWKKSRRTKKIYTILQFS